MRSRSRPSSSVRQAVAGLALQTRQRLGQVALAGRSQALLEARHPGRSATFVTPATRSAMRR